MTRSGRMAIVSIVMALALGGIARPGMAQFDLPEEIVRATDLTPEQVGQIQQHVQEGITGLASKDPRQLKQARERLLAPLRRTDVSVRFRQEYSNTIVPQLKAIPLDNDLTAVNVLRVAGELATSEGAALLEGSLADDRVAVRYAAVAGLGRTFDALTANSPAITADRAGQLVSRLGQRVEQEPSNAVADAGVRALVSAMNVTRQGWEGLRGTALSVMSASLGARVKAGAANVFDPELAVAATRGGQAARDAVNDPARSLNEEQLKRAAELSGFSLAYVVRRQRGGDFPAGDTAAREGAAQLVGMAETTIPIAARKLGVGGPQPQGGLSEDFRKATAEGDRAFVQKAAEMLLVLERAPFSFPQGHFLPEERAGRR